MPQPVALQRRDHVAVDVWALIEAIRGASFELHLALSDDLFTSASRRPATAERHAWARVFHVDVTRFEAKVALHVLDL